MLHPAHKQKRPYHVHKVLTPRYRFKRKIIVAAEVTLINTEKHHDKVTGCIAEYASSDIQLDKVEIAEAAWFNINKLPELPPAISLSRRLIDSFIASRR